MNNLFRTFYAAKQETGESVANYGMRLEGLLQTCIDRGDISLTARNEMLRSKLWSGLSDVNLRNASRYKFDTIRDFEALRMELRTIELDLKATASSPPSVSATSSKDAKKSQVSQISDSNSSMDAIMRKLEAMNKRMAEIEKKSRGQKVNHLLITSIMVTHMHIAVADPECSLHILVRSEVDLADISEVDPVEISGADLVDSTEVDPEALEAVIEVVLEAVTVMDSEAVLEADPEVDSEDTPGADTAVIRDMISHTTII